MEKLRTPGRAVPAADWLSMRAQGDEAEEGDNDNGVSPGEYVVLVSVHEARAPAADLRRSPVQPSLADMQTGGAALGRWTWTPLSTMGVPPGSLAHAA